MAEPLAPTPAPKPCSTPHSAPSRWLKYDPGILPPPPAAAEDPVLSEHEGHDLTTVADRLRSDPEALAEFIEQVSPPQGRGDGWSPFARKLFLQVLADTGKASVAAEYAGLSRQSAYNLAQRDPLFAAAWDAAALMARRPMDDTAREQMLDGITRRSRAATARPSPATATTSV